MDISDMPRSEEEHILPAYYASCCTDFPPNGGYVLEMVDKIIFSHLRNSRKWYSENDAFLLNIFQYFWFKSSGKPWYKSSIIFNVSCHIH